MRHRATKHGVSARTGMGFERARVASPENVKVQDGRAKAAGVEGASPSHVSHAHGHLRSQGMNWSDWCRGSPGTVRRCMLQSCRHLHALLGGSRRSMFLQTTNVLNSCSERLLRTSLLAHVLHLAATHDSWLHGALCVAPAPTPSKSRRCVRVVAIYPCVGLGSLACSDLCGKGVSNSL